MARFVIEGGVPLRGEVAVSAAKNAGVPVVVTTFGYTDIPAADLDADALIDHFEQLPAVATRLLAREPA